MNQSANQIGAPHRLFCEDHGPSFVHHDCRVRGREAVEYPVSVINAFACAIALSPRCWAPRWSPRRRLGDGGTTIDLGNLPTRSRADLPLLRLHFNAPTKAKTLPPLVTRPLLATKWQQIGPTTSRPSSPVRRTAHTTTTSTLPTAMTLRADLPLHRVTTTSPASTTNLHVGGTAPRRARLPAPHLHPGTPQSDPSEQVNGTFAWSYPNLPSELHVAVERRHRQRHLARRADDLPEPAQPARHR